MSYGEFPVDDWRTKSLREFKKEYDSVDFQMNGFRGNTKYYQDYYGNEYIWYVEKQKDGYFHGRIEKERRNAKTQHFKRKVKRVLKTLLALKCQEADKRYLIAMEKRDAKKPPPKSKTEIKMEKAIQAIRSIDKNNKKHETDIKMSNTWIKKNNKKRKELVKRLKRLQSK